jgi:hypothetical protein
MDGLEQFKQLFHLVDDVSGESRRCCAEVKAFHIVVFWFLGYQDGTYLRFYTL